MPQALLHDLRVNIRRRWKLTCGISSKIAQGDRPPAEGESSHAGVGTASHALCRRKPKAHRLASWSQKETLRSPATNSQPCWATILPMATWAHHTGKGRVRARKQRSNLLEVWLELFEKIEGPRRRRAAEFRRRRDNPIRRIKNRSSQLRDYASLR